MLLLVGTICLAFLVSEHGVCLLGAVKERWDTLHQPDAGLCHSFVPGKVGVGLCTTGNGSTACDARSVASVW